MADRHYYCPVQLTVEALSSKWKPMIVWHLVLHGKMLTQSLRELESDGLVNRTVHKVVPPKVAYALSRKGKTLQKKFLPMREGLAP
jgi:DNA-binding HxlR family transcriptional regulator